MSRALRRLAPGLGVLLVACGKRGDPLPPLPVTPQPVQNLRVAQRGDHVEIAYTAPRATTGGGGHLGVLTVELRRAETAGDFAKVSKRLREKVAPGESRILREPLPPAGTELRFMARVINRGSPSSPTPLVSLHVQGEVPLPTDLVAELLEDSVALRWACPDPLPDMVLPPPPPPPKPTPPPFPVRSPAPSPGAASPGAVPSPSPGLPSPTPGPTSTQPSPLPIPQPSPSPGAASPGAVPSPSPGLPSPTPGPTSTQVSPSPLPVPLASPSSSLSPGPSPSPQGPPPPPGPGGFFVYRRAPEGEYTAPLSPLLAWPSFSDTSVHPGENWCYVVRTVISRDPVIESQSSNEACLEIKDITPPAAPTGFAALPHEGGIALSWSPSSEEDLALYRIYRAEGEGSPVSLADVPPTETSFEDRTVKAGVSYRYTLTALDRAGNESQRSSPADGRIP
jgi:hypothetical protein